MVENVPKKFRKNMPWKVLFPGHEFFHAMESAFPMAWIFSCHGRSKIIGNVWKFLPWMLCSKKFWMNIVTIFGPILKSFGHGPIHLSMGEPIFDIIKSKFQNFHYSFANKTRLNLDVLIHAPIISLVDSAPTLLSF